MLLWALGCSSPSSPLPYDLIHPNLIVELPHELIEISGLARFGADSLLFHDDEIARISKSAASIDSILPQFNSTLTGDFEGIAIHEGKIWLLESDGTLRMADVSQNQDTGLTFTPVIVQNLRKEVEYEGLAYDPIANKLFIAAKQSPPGKKNTHEVYSCDPTGENAKVEFIVEESALKKYGIDDFKPSGIEKHPVTGDWYLLSAHFPAIAIYTAQYELKYAQLLDEEMLWQPEAITFTESGDLIIGTEGKKKKNIPGKILVFKFNP